eukprot:jgi/Mesvir1/6954/Mv26514-RA.1
MLSEPSTPLRSLFLVSILCTCLLQAALGAAASSEGAAGNHPGLPVLESLFGALKRQEEGPAPGSQANTMELPPLGIDEHPCLAAERSVQDTAEHPRALEGEEQPPLSLEFFLRAITRNPRLTEHVKGQVPPGGLRVLVAGSYPSALVAWDRAGLQLPFNDVDFSISSEFRDRDDPWGKPTTRKLSHCAYVHVNGVPCPVNIVVQPYLNLEKLIDGFDVNCVKTGVEVILHPSLPYYSARWYVAPAFEEFLQTRVLEIDSLTGLATLGPGINGNSLVRLIIKSEELGFEFKLPGPDARTGFDRSRIWSKKYDQLCKRGSEVNQELFNRLFRVDTSGTDDVEYTVRVWDVVCSPPDLVDMLYYGPDGGMCMREHNMVYPTRGSWLSCSVPQPEINGSFGRMRPVGRMLVKSAGGGYQGDNQRSARNRENPDHSSSSLPLSRPRVRVVQDDEYEW